MTDILHPVLELSIIIPGILLAYLPVKSYLRLSPLKLTAWLLPLLLGICILGGAVCYALHLPTRWVLFPLLPVIILIYHKTLKISGLEIRQYFSGSLRSFCMCQQPVPGIQCTYNC